MHSLLTTMLTFAELSSKSFIQRAVSNPMKPASVLSYFFGLDYDDDQAYKETMRNAGPVFQDMQRFWFMQSDEYDQYCQPFVPVVRAAGNRELMKDPTWSGSVDGIISQIVLCDQLSRNCFRGTSEAFAYDSVAEELSLSLIDDYYMRLDNNMNKENDDPQSKSSSNSCLPGEYFAPYIAFMVLPLMHSEKLEGHVRGLEVLDGAIVNFEDQPDTVAPLALTRSALEEHKEVLSRFGRYPHRNGKLGRENSPDEQAWLDDWDNLPGWAKSQL